MLKINDLHVSVEGTDILKGINLTVNSGEVHAIMGLTDPVKVRYPVHWLAVKSTK